MEKKKMIILFGSDGSGKTTIANTLSYITGYKIKHFGPAKSLEDGKQEYFSFARDNNEDIILDRFYEGERIYAPLYRGYSADYFRELEKELMEKYEVLLVLVYAPYNIIEKRLNERGEDFVAKEHFRTCYNAVTQEFNDSILPKMMIDTNEDHKIFNSIKILTKLNGYNL
jgi:thymidylate kinase